MFLAFFGYPLEKLLFGERKRLPEKEEPVQGGTFVVGGLLYPKGLKTVFGTSSIRNQLWHFLLRRYHDGIVYYIAN